MRSAFLFMTMLVAGCSSADASDPSSPSSSGSSSSSTGGTSGTQGTSSGSSGTSGASGTSGTSGTSTSAQVPANCNGDEGGPVPSEPNALGAWLRTGKYKCWTHESAKHPSTGPHGGDIQTYLNASLDASMKGTGEHPQGAVAVKELYSSGTTVTGWAVGVKTQAASAGGAGWYWYEVFGTQPGASTIEGQNKSLCTNCHAAGGRDFVLIPYPLR